MIYRSLCKLYTRDC